MNTLIDSYIRYLDGERGAADNTCQAYFRDLQQFATFLDARFPALADAKQLDRIDESILREFLADLYDRLSPTSLERKISALRSFFSFLPAYGTYSAQSGGCLKSSPKGTKATGLVQHRRNDRDSAP